MVSLSPARARGRVGGCPPKLDAKKINRDRQLYKKKEMTVKEICDWAGISKGTLYKYINNRISY
jgi:DNA invertase Pin-like site-specific DNA recombinase